MSILLCVWTNGLRLEGTTHTEKSPTKVRKSDSSACHDSLSGDKIFLSQNGKIELSNKGREGAFEKLSLAEVCKSVIGEQIRYPADSSAELTQTSWLIMFQTFFHQHCPSWCPRHSCSAGGVHSLSGRLYPCSGTRPLLFQRQPGSGFSSTSLKELSTTR